MHAKKTPKKPLYLLHLLSTQCKTPYSVVISMNINLGKILVILCARVEMKLKPLNISSCLVIFTVLKYQNFSKILRRLKCKKKQALFLLYWTKTNNSKSLNQEILKSVISYLKATHFDAPLIHF